ncbi:MAG: hypothetical protein FWE34_05790 [Defluviitaleaceae bacterium]|nr:hypothetical protein [Defluviitaleaceae bacterium]
MNIDVKSEAIKLFNETWDLIDLAEQSDEQKALMLHKAHTDRYLWGLVGEPMNFARCEWQISRCYALLGMGDAALLHGELSLALALENGLGALDLAFGHEAVARACALLGQNEKVAEHKEKGLAAAAGLEKEGDREYTKRELNGVDIKGGSE